MHEVFIKKIEMLFQVDWVHYFKGNNEINQKIG